MKKTVLFLKLNILYMFRNKVRFVLTICGITIGLLIYILGNIAVEAYIGALYREAYAFDGDSLFIADEDGKTINKLARLEWDNDIYKCGLAGEAYNLNNTYLYKGIRVVNTVSLVGLEGQVQGKAIPCIGDTNISLTRTKIIYGRDLSYEDISQGKNSAIIERSSAMYLFQRENAVGERLDVISPYGYDQFEIVGIIEDTPSTKNKNLEFNKTVQDGKEEYINMVTAYTSYDYLKRMAGDNLQDRYIIDTEGMNTDEIDDKIGRLNDENAVYNIKANITSQNMMLEDVSATENELRGFINTLILIIILISGFMIVTIYMFSVKERMYEIGVRRAVGASGFDIIMQFVTEGVVTAVTAGAVALLTGVIICNFGTSYFINNLYMDIRLIMSGKLIFSMLGLSVLQGIVFCFVPAVIASKIRPTEAIRLE